MLTVAAAQAAKRVALVIGNADYRHAGKLINTINDATDMGAALTALGFQVLDGFDLDKVALDRKVREFATALEGAEAGVFFYSGHGLQVAGQNYIVPIDAALTTAAALELEMLRLDVVHRIMERLTNTNILFLDACRNNPLARNLAQAMGTRSVDVAKGFAPTQAGLGTPLAFSTEPDNVALDGSGRNSPFTGPLVQHIATSKDDLNTILMSVRTQVVKETQGRQVPWEHSSMMARFYFSPTALAKSKHAEAAIAVTPTQCDGLDASLGSDRRCLKPNDTFKDCPDCPEMMVVPAGTFVMGSPAREQGRSDDEGPQRTVTMERVFAVGKHEVTFADWDACLAVGGCKHNPDDEGWGRDKRPVINVSWDDITKEYLPWLSRKTGRTYRLLTEAEWEYAARAGSGTRFHFGDNERDLCTYANVADLTAKEKYKDWTVANCRDGHVNTAAVGSLKVNPFGLHDMHGNVWE